MAFQKLTGIQQLDFQINRVLMYGDLACRQAEVCEALRVVSDLPAWFQAWYAIAQVAEQEERYLHAAYYYRMAEFFLKDSDPQKAHMYVQSIRYFHRIILQQDTISIQWVPYQGKQLKAMVFTQAEGGEQHCQVGNHHLAVDFIAKWLAS